jgi:putative oxidoreductase
LIVLLFLCFVAALLVGGFGFFLLLGSKFPTLWAKRWVSLKLVRATQIVRYKEIQIGLQEWAITVLRIATGLVFLMNGGEKLFGGDFNSTVVNLTQLQGGSLPLLIAMAGTLAEFLCGAALVLGLFTRWASIPLAIVMVGDLLLFHPPSGFFVDDVGFHYAMLRLAACVALMLAGPGRFALGSLLVSLTKSTLPHRPH